VSVPVPVGVLVPVGVSVGVGVLVLVAVIGTVMLALVQPETVQSFSNPLQNTIPSLVTWNR
jgi:hypothetical protein